MGWKTRTLLWCGVMVAAVVLCNALRSRPGSVAANMAVVHAQSTACDAATATSDQNLAWCGLQAVAAAVHGAAFGSAAANPMSWRSVCELASFKCPAPGVAGAVKQVKSNVHVAAMVMAHDARPALRPGDTDVDVNTLMSVFYNPTAQDGLAQCLAQKCAQGINFGDGSELVRLDWLDIAPEACTRFYGFDADEDTADYDPQFVVTIDSHSNGPACAGAPNTVFPVSQFLYVRRAESSAAAFEQITGGQITAADHIVVVLGVNVMQKVAGNWAWSTFWWSRIPSPTMDARSGLVCGSSNPCPAVYGDASHPMDLGHYVMNFVSTTMKPTDTFAAVSNPYLDSTAGIKMNCVVCHNFAMTPAAWGAGSPHDHLCGAQDATQLTPAQLAPIVVDYQTQQMDGCPVTKRVTTDMAWSVAGLVPTCTPNVGRQCVATSATAAKR